MPSGQHAEEAIMSQHRAVVDQVRRAFQFLRERRAYDDHSPLLDEFPVAAVDNVIVGTHGSLIASLPTTAMAEDVAQRLNEGEWRRQEELWAL
jgi:hypothetical protein